MESYFRGKKELFQDLYIGKEEKEWNAFPILHFDFSGGTYTDEDGLSEFLNDAMNHMITDYDLTDDF